jgi:hypothetical protein
MGLTKFSDTTEEEFKEFTNVGAPQAACSATAKATLERPTVKEIPLKMILPVDWR